MPGAPGTTLFRLFSTGVDDRGQELPGGSQDAHFRLVKSGKPAVVLSDLWSTWPRNDAQSAWIGWTDTPFPNKYGPFVYRTTFRLVGYDPNTATLSGQWAADNEGYIVLNGHRTDNWVQDEEYLGLTLFTISSGFQPGLNTLDFVVNQPDGYDGLRVANLVVTARRAPKK